MRGTMFLVVVLSALFVKFATTAHGGRRSDVDSDVNRTCNHVTSDGQRVAAVNGANEIRNCSGLCMNSSERFSRSSTLRQLSGQLLSHEENVHLNISEVELDSGIFIPAFQLFNCAVKSLHRFRKMERHLTDNNLTNGVTKIKESRNFLRKMCESHMYNTCCHKSVEGLALRGYMKVPSCSDVAFHLGKGLRISSWTSQGPRENQTYLDFLNAQTYDERLRAKLFLDAYLKKAFL